MKNLPKAERQRRRAPSGYSRKNKAPYVYSEPLQRWHSAAVKHDHNAMDSSHTAWLRTMALQRRKDEQGVNLVEKPEPLPTRRPVGGFSPAMRRAFALMTPGAK